MKKIVLEKEEQLLEREIESGAWSEVDNLEKEKMKFQSIAQNTLNKSKKINIRLTDWDYRNMKIKAVQEGLPYQTLISSLIHKFLTGQINTNKGNF